MFVILINVNTSVFGVLSVVALFFFLANFVVLWALTLFEINSFEAKFSLLMNRNQVRLYREFEFFKTENLQESTQLERALLKVIPKIP